MDSIEVILQKLKRSKFRNSFKLKEKDLKYIKEKGIDKIRFHAYDFVNKNLKIRLINDGKQTPTHNHPVFIAQHATATCCRGCLEKWYKIPSNRNLNDNEINYVVEVIMRWINKNS